MRLDHLLSRDLGACGGRGARTGASPGPLVARREGPDGRMHGSTLPSHPAFCWVGGGCPPLLLWGVGACCRGLGLRALCVLLLLPPVVLLPVVVVVWGVVGVWVGWL